MELRFVSTEFLEEELKDSFDVRLYNIDGMFRLYDDGNTFIFVREDSNILQKIWTIIHELGHWITSYLDPYLWSDLDSLWDRLWGCD